MFTLYAETKGNSSAIVFMILHMLETSSCGLASPSSHHAGIGKFQISKLFSGLEFQIRDVRLRLIMYMYHVQCVGNTDPIMEWLGGAHLHMTTSDTLVSFFGVASKFFVKVL